MKAKDYRAMDAEKRRAELSGLLREQFNLRLQKATGQLANGAAVRTVRRNIARLLTVANQKAD